MTDLEWVVMEGFDLAAAHFPLTAQVDGEEVVIFRVGDKLRAIQRWCPHSQADMAGGKLMGEMVKCPKHGYIFRFSDGKGMNCPGVNAKVYEVAIEGSRLVVKRK